MFDERYFLYAEEADWQLRARRRGGSVLYCDDVEAEHIGGGTGGSRVEREMLFHASHERFVRKWYGALGWHLARLGVLAGATARGLIRRGARGQDDLRRARIYLEGPVRALERGAINKLKNGSAADVRVDTDRRLKVAQVVCADEFAGVERYVVTIASGLARQGCDVTVVGGHPGQMANWLRPDGVRWFPGATVPIALAQLVRLGRFDIVHAHMSQAELVAALALPVTRAKIVTTRHFARRRGSSPSARAFAALAPVAVGEQLAISGYVAQSIDGSSVVVRPGVPDVADPTPLDDRENVVLVLQRLAPEKHTEVGIESFARSGLAALGWQLEIAGTGEMESELRERADRLGLGESCRFLGQRFDVDTLYRRASIFLATRPDEPYGLSVLEAMSYGLPVVAPRGGGHVETVGIAAGATLFPPGDLDAAASMLERLATAPALRAQYGGELRRIQQERFTIATQVDATLAVYRRLVT
jgi:glycosyltransferase involved in cell wall biosynthesis